MEESVKLERLANMFDMLSDPNRLNAVIKDDLRRIKKEYATDESELRVGTYNEQQGRPINPKYIVGYYMNGDITTFIHNSKFYGFKEEKDGEFPQIDLEKIEEENERIKQINAERAGKSIQELGKERFTGFTL